MIVRDFQRIIGVEARQQVLEPPGGCPTRSPPASAADRNAIGVFHAFLADGTSGCSAARPAARGRPSGAPPR